MALPSRSTQLGGISSATSLKNNKPQKMRVLGWSAMGLAKAEGCRRVCMFFGE
jgi:hypothetical protein